MIKHFTRDLKDEKEELKELETQIDKLKKKVHDCEYADKYLNQMLEETKSIRTVEDLDILRYHLGELYCILPEDWSNEGLEKLIWPILNRNKKELKKDFAIHLKSLGPKNILLAPGWLDVTIGLQADLKDGRRVVLLLDFEVEEMQQMVSVGILPPKEEGKERGEDDVKWNEFDSFKEALEFLSSAGSDKRGDTIKTTPKM